MANKVDPKRHKMQNDREESRRAHTQKSMGAEPARDPKRHAKQKVPSGKSRVVDMDRLIEAKNADYATRTVDYNPVDATFLMLVMILLLFGLVMVFSASYAQSLEDNGSASYYFTHQLGFAVFGLVCMFGFGYLVNYYYLKKWTVLFYVVCLILLLAVVFFGEETNNAVRWIRIGSIRFQPSEFAKIAVIFFMARWCENHRNRMKNLDTAILGFAIAVVPVVGLLALQPHFSCAILIVATAFIMLYIGGIGTKWFWPIVGLGGFAVVLFICLGDRIPVDYIANRWTAWKNPAMYQQGTGYQTMQSLMALGSGGLFGVGLGNSRQKQLFLPESHNDYILSIVGEELGLFGILVILLLFALLIWRGVVIARKARDRFGFLLVIGIMAKIALQVLLNLAVVTNAIPVTGMALPFFSYGGTALVAQLAEIGVVLNISRQARPDENNIKQ